MRVSKFSKENGYYYIQKGEIIGITVQSGSQHKNEQLPIFSHRYAKKTLKYLMVKSIDRDAQTSILIDLDTKQEYTINQGWIDTDTIYKLFKTEIKELAERIKFVNWDNYKSEVGDVKTFSTTISIYPSFIVTGLSSNVMKEDGTFTFTLNDIDSIYLDKIARHKYKIMLKNYR